jgi:hypothetical protein
MGKDEADGVSAYTEKDVRENGAYGLMKAVDLLPMVFSE